MTRVNKVDSLASELREIKRRLHALETALGARPAAGPGTRAVAGPDPAQGEEKAS
jgi:hypothetical protein